MRVDVCRCMCWCVLVLGLALALVLAWVLVLMFVCVGADVRAGVLACVLISGYGFMCSGAFVYGAIFVGVPVGCGLVCCIVCWGLLVCACVLVCV